MTNLCVFDFETTDRSLRLRSLHPGVSVDDVRGATGFEFALSGDVPPSRTPTDQELWLIRDVLDPEGLREAEVPPT